MGELAIENNGFFDLNDEVHTGPYKMIRTVEDYWSAINADQFIGCAWCFELPRRIESNELVSFVGEFKTGYHGETEYTSIDFTLKIPRIPYSLLSVVIADFKDHPTEERIFQIRWNILSKEYVIVIPTSSRATKCAIEYDFKDVPSHLKPILEIHSHNTMPAYFSSTDDNDELLKGFYGVVGNVDQECPSMKFRVGMEGAFSEVPIHRLFDLEL